MPVHDALHRAVDTQRATSAEPYPCQFLVPEPVWWIDRTGVWGTPCRPGNYPRTAARYDCLYQKPHAAPAFRQAEKLP